MKRVFMFLLTVSLLIGIGTISGALAAGDGKKEASILYVCNCGDACACKTVATQPGKCSCGKDLAAMHVLKIEKENAVLCTCGKGCNCALDAKDNGKCGCGKAVKTVSLKGLYACSCGSACPCNTVSDKAGKCGCGSALKKIE